jgi:Undecaprenyl-phosphate galactose phosphotransferase WbaP
MMPSSRQRAHAQPVSAPAPLVDIDIRAGRLFHRFGRNTLLAATDTTMIAVSGALAYIFWAAPVHGQSAGMYLELLPLVFLFIAGYERVGLYPGLGLGPVETLRRFTYVTLFGFLMLAAFSFALKLPHLYSRVTFVLAFALSVLLVPLGRVAVTQVAVRWRWWAEPVVVIGTGRRASHAIRTIQENRQLGYRVAAILAPDTAASSNTQIEGVPVVGGLDRTAALVAGGIRVAFLETEMQTLEVFDRLQQDFRHVILLREFDDLPVEGLQVRNLGTLVGIEYRNNLLRRANQAAKRALDLLIGSALLILFAPVIVVAGMTVLVIDGSPAFFHQNRTGLAGRRIRVPKIRTMRRDADIKLDEYLSSSQQARDEWQTRYKLRADPRLIPGIGNFFRRFSIDELPQLWAVIVGDMSLVGPRPFPDYHLKQFTPAFLEIRQRVRPGITGFWQITLRSQGSTEDQEALDSYYIRNWSVWFDLYVLARTVTAVASGRGAY